MNALTAIERVLADDLHGWGAGWMRLWGTIMMLGFVALIAFAWAIARTIRDDA